LGLNLAKMGLNFEAPAHPFYPGAPNGDFIVISNILEWIITYSYL
jgi:hypothetical protein